MTTTTFALLDDGTGEAENNALLNQVEVVTGNRIAYGYSTPINIVDILNQVGVVAALTCLPYAVEDVNLLSQIIGVKLCEQYSYIWNSIRPDDTRAATLLGWMDIILSGENVAGTPRTDYCGRDLTGPALIPDNQIAAELAAIKADIDPLTAQGAPTTYTIMINNTGPLTPTQIASLMSGGEVVSLGLAGGFLDPAQSAPVSLTGYVAHTITDSIANDLYVQNVVNYSATSEYFYNIVYRPIFDGNHGTTVTNYANLAVKSYFAALELAVNQVRFATPFSLGQVYTFLRNSHSYYNNWQQQSIRPTLTNVGQAYNGRVPSTQAIKDAGTNARVAALRDFAFVSSFDASSDGILSSSERLAMEVGLQSRMLSARQAAATPIIASVQAQFDSFSNNTDDLAPIIAMYLSL